MTRLKSATARMSQPNVSSLRGPWRPSSGIGARRSRVERAEVRDRTHAEQVRPKPNRASPVERQVPRGRIGGSRESQQRKADQDRRDQLPDHGPAGEEQDLARGDECCRRQQRCGRKPEGAWPLRILAPESSERERGHCVHGHGRRRDEADELLPAGKRKEDHQAAEERERDREERRSAWREAGEGRRDKAVASECEGEARARARVDQTGASRRDDCV